MANVLETSMNYLQTQDPEVAACIENEFQRQKQNIELSAEGARREPNLSGKRTEPQLQLL